MPDGSRVHYSRISAGTGWTDAVFENSTSSDNFYKSRIYWNGNGWNLVLKNGTVYVFGENNPLQAIRDRHGNTLTLTRINGQGGNITKITSPNGRWVQFTYSGNRITQATDNLGRTVQYVYDGSGRLTQVTDANNGVTQYTYDVSNRMTSITDARNIVYLRNYYDANGMVIKQIQADDSVYLFQYTLDSSGNVTRTDVTDPRGNVRRVTFNPPPVYPSGFVAGGSSSAQTYALGTSAESASSYDRGQAATNPAERIQSSTDALGRRTDFSYDAMGNLTRVTRLAGTLQAVTTTYTYEPRYNQLASVTDPLGHTTSFNYDSSGNLVSVADALGNQSTFSRNSLGQIITSSGPLGNTTQFQYNGADLASVTDPLGHRTTFFADAAGRILSTTNALGQITRYEYNNLNLVTKVTDALGSITSFTYDPNGNLLSLTDARNTTTPTTYTYDSVDRLYTRTDPLNRTESSQYDGNGNLMQFTDRRGKVTTFQYDALNRRTFGGFGTGPGPTYESTIQYTYDAGNRLTQLDDPASGTITRTFDGLDRLTSETTPQGSISYTYDNAGRRSTMTVAGQPTVNYTWDDANHLVQIAQGASTVSFSYDPTSRRTLLMLPNGITVQYSYDQDSRLTGMTFRLGATVLGDLSYSYDAANRRTQMSGSFARTGLPQPLGSATYDAANELTNFAGTTFAYDANGNLTSDGSNTYVWDARNQLSSLNGISFQYDGLGRRTRNAAGIQFLYDGANATLELSGTTPTANLVAGGGFDELFTRTQPGGSFSFLTDGVGSVLALADSGGILQTQYTYEAFGATTIGGAANNNTFQYTGRENDATGLYYYRTRYYNPTFGRFISEDPLGFLTGDANLYSYVSNSPLSFVDPLGLDKNRWKEEVCRYIPEGRTGGLSGGLGFLGGQTGTLEVVVNYNTGEVSGFASGGLQAGYNGVLQGSIPGGFVYNLGNSNANYQGPFTNGSVSVGPVGVFTGVSSGGFTSPQRVNRNGANVVGASLGASLLGPVTATGSVTYYSKPLSMGNMFANPSAPPFQALDLLMYLARQACN